MPNIAKFKFEALIVLVAVIAAVVVSRAETMKSADPSSPAVAVPTAQAPDPVLVGAGDIASCDDLAGARATAKLIENIPGTVFAAGDLAYPNGSDEDFTNCYGPTWGRFKDRTRPAPGNHEYHSDGASGYVRYFGAAAGDPNKGYYSYDLGAWHIIALNSECAKVGGCDAASPQGHWLYQDLAEHRNGCTLAYFHKPLFSSGLSHGNDPQMKALWEALYHAGTDIVINGHDHDYERFAPQDPEGSADPKHGIREFVVGSGGKNSHRVFAAPKPNSEVRNADTFGVLKLTLHAKSYDWEFVPEAGKSFTDSGVGNCLLGAPAPSESNYQVTRKIEIPGQGSWDYLTIDDAARRLYVSHGTQVEVLDVDSGTIVGKIPNTLGVHGIAVAPELGRGFVTNGQSSTVTVFDLKTLKPVGEVPVGKKPDATIYDPATSRVFAFNGGSNSASVISAADAKVVGTIDLGGGPEFAVADGTGYVFNNLEDESQVVKIDSRKMRVEERWPTAPCQSPSSLAMDRANHRLFIGCRSHVMAVMNADTGQVITTLPIGDHVDATAFDPDSRLIFNSNGEGTVTVIRQETPDKYSVSQNVKTLPRAKTMALDLKTHQLFLSTAEAGQFVVLVVGK